jgi:hypothetical protein
MRPKEHRESGEQDLFRSRLDQIIDMDRALVKLSGSIDWRFLEQRLGAVYTDKPGHPPTYRTCEVVDVEHGSAAGRVCAGPGPMYAGALFSTVFKLLHARRWRAHNAPAKTKYLPCKANNWAHTSRQARFRVVKTCVSDAATHSQGRCFVWLGIAAPFTTLLAESGTCGELHATVDL